MRYAAGPAAVAALLLAGCADTWPDPPSIDAETLLAEHEDWRLYRQGRLVTPPGGAVLWNGLFDIPQGITELGSDESRGITLAAEDSPPLAGRLERVGQVVTLHPEPEAGILVRTEDPDDDERVVETPVSEPMVLGDDRSDETTTLVLGSLGMRVHSEPGTDRLWLRTWDEDMPERETFTVPPYFPVSSEWRLVTRYEPYDEPETMQFADVTGGLIEYRVPGRLTFRKDGREHTLSVTAGESSRDFFILMWDSTATVNTYQGGRYIHADFPDEAGWTFIDFNRAYNAPCVFTEFSVCALPPRENWLELPVTAGEQRPDKPAH